jgi:hypothetical protein
MDNLVRLVYNPFSFNYDFDRSRRIYYDYYGRYEPTKLKKLMMWLFNERIKPVNWEEVPPFEEPPEESANLILPRDGKFHPYECLTQPDMLTKNNIYFRRVLLLGATVWLYRYLQRNELRYVSIYGFNFYYQKTGFKVFFLLWFYYMACRIYIHRDYQLPYN